MSGHAIVAIAIIIGGCVHRPPETSQPLVLDELLAFADPASCAPGASYAILLGEMVAGDANVGFRPGKVAAPVRYAAAFGRVNLQSHEGYTVIGASVRGTLYGLPIVAVEQSLPDGGDPGETHIRFRAAPDAVERVLAERGFRAKLGQSVAIGPPDGYEHFIELIVDPVHPGHTLLSCGYR